MRRKLADLDHNLAPPWREQYSPQEEARQDAELRWWEEHDWMLDLEPDWEEAYPR